MKGNMVFAKRIKELREEKEISQEKLGERFGYKKQTVSKWENNGQVPRDLVLRELANFFQTTTDYLLGHSNHRNNNEIFEHKSSTQSDEIYKQKLSLSRVMEAAEKLDWDEEHKNAVKEIKALSAEDQQARLDKAFEQFLSLSPEAREALREFKNLSPEAREALILFIRKLASSRQ